MSILEKDIKEISSWRESTINSNISKQLRYGQSFYNIDELISHGHIFDIVPYLSNTIFTDCEHTTVYNYLKISLPKSKCILSEQGLGKAEGIILRNYDRSKIVKIRFQDYIKTLR